MAYIKENWSKKEQAKKDALAHSRKMEELYGEEIKRAVESSIIYSEKFSSDVKAMKEQSIIVVDMDTVQAAEKYRNGKTAVLNFSSYKNPGGMFLSGSIAQEECLCHKSFLYNVLKQFTESFYDWNIQHKNKALYLNRAIYSPDIRFEYNGKSFRCDVITCAAPNKSAAQKYQNVSNEENSKVLHSRMKFVLDIAKENNADTLILGAYGCGVFGQDATEVAEIFKSLLSKGYFKQVVFAIPEGNNGNLQKFKNVI